MNGEAQGADKGMGRRKFLLLAGAAATLGGLLVATKGKGVSTLLKTQQATQPQATQGRYVKTASSGQLTQASPLTEFLSKLFGGRL